MARRSTSVATGAAPWVRTRRLPVSRGRASCSSFIAASIAGTAMVAVQRSRSSRSSAVAGSKAGRTTWLAPIHVAPRTQKVPAAWNIGAIASHRSSGCRPIVSRLLIVLASRLRWLSITPLAAPVVPPV